MGPCMLPFYAPLGGYPQQPHVQAEVYLVMLGQDQFFCGEVSKGFAVRDMLFVTVGFEHRFLDFTV